MSALSDSAAKTQPDIDRTLLTRISPEFIRNASKSDLAALQKLAGFGETWGVLEISPEYRAGSRTAKVYLKPSSLKIGDASASSIERLVLELTRLTIAMAYIPSHFGKVLRHTSILTNVGCARRLLIRAGLQRGSKHVWSRIVIDGGMKKSERIRAEYIWYFHMLGCLPDGPASPPVVRGRQSARDRTGEPEHNSQPRSISRIQPYSDTFTSEAGYTAAILIEIVGPTLLDAVEEALKIAPASRGVGDGRSTASRNRATSSARDRIIKNWPWRGPDGVPLIDLPLTFHFESSKRTRPESWPPKSFYEARRMVHILQGAHVFPIGLATGNRHGELLSMQVGSLATRSNGNRTVPFRTWKFAPPGGQLSEAPVPSMACTAIEQQERLAGIFKAHRGVSNEHLWISIGNPRKKPVLSTCLGVFVRGMGLTRHLTDGGANPQRFRKTLARLAALALVHAPQILMDVFGHRDEQMTIMRYILSDPAILSEIQTLVREMIILKGVEAVQTVETVQGAGAAKFRERVAAYVQRLGKSALEPENLNEFASAMTEAGTSWAVIAPGIVCTSFTKGGLCNKGRGTADPHYCNPQCDSQLVMPDGNYDFRKAVVSAIETVEYVLQLIQSAQEEQNDMLVAQFQGQIRSILNRFREVDAHFSKDRRLKRLVPDVVLLP